MYNMNKPHEPSMQWLSFLLLMVSSSSIVRLSAGDDTITINKSITRNQTIISAAAKFALGFFTPNNSTNSYLGIWYYTVPKLTVIWVANRASPIPKGSPPLCQLSEDGNLVILSGRKVVWTSNMSAVGANINSIDAVLLDNGNLVLRHGEGGTVWQSFDHPTDTFVPEMKISSNRRTGHQTRLTSWVDNEDPRPGTFSIGIDPNSHQFILWKGDEPYWRSNVYATTFSFASGFLRYDKGFSTYLSYIVEQDEDYLTTSNSANIIRTKFTLVPSGQIQLVVWVQTAWIVIWQTPLATCDFYGYCGPFTICQKNESLPSCKCLTGFQPKSHNGWIKGNWTGGCVRNKTLSCDKGDMFLRYEGMKLPDHAVSMGNRSLSNCALECFKNCSCTAYAYENVTYEETIVCLNWFRELEDVMSNYTTGHNLYVRVHNSELGSKTQKYSSMHIRKQIIAIAAAIVSVGLLLLFTVFGYFIVALGFPLR